MLWVSFHCGSPRILKLTLRAFNLRLPPDELSMD